jgi:curved DNA-binding protein CbpA
MNIEECLRILELEPGATIDEVKAARNELLQVWHPDKYLANSKLSEKAQEKTLKINEAFAVLVGELKLKEQLRDSQPDRSAGKKIVRSRVAAYEDDFQRELKHFARQQESRLKYKELRIKQRNRAKRQFYFTFLYALLAGLAGMALGLKEFALLFVIVVLGIGFLISFLTYRTPIKKRASSKILKL